MDRPSRPDSWSYRFTRWCIGSDPVDFTAKAEAQIKRYRDFEAHRGLTPDERRDLGQLAELLRHVDCAIHDGKIKHDWAAFPSRQTVPVE